MFTNMTTLDISCTKHPCQKVERFETGFDDK